MTTDFKPMLAAEAHLEALQYPLHASPKLDGIRAIVRGGVVLSRSLKPIPNKFVQQQFSHLEHFDGELIVGDPTSKTVYRDTVSHVMSHDKADYPVSFFVFDHIGAPGRPYRERHEALQGAEAIANHQRVTLHHQEPIDNARELLEYEATCLDLGYEGLILRATQAPYKFGRSTTREGWLLKLKRFADDEARIIDFYEQMKNNNVAETNELGRTKRSSHKENKAGKGTLGALHVSWKGMTFEIGTGMDDDLRQKIWDNRERYVGKLVKFKYFPIGMKDKPRHPVFLGFRDPKDL